MIAASRTFPGIRPRQCPARADHDGSISYGLASNYTDRHRCPTAGRHAPPVTPPSLCPLRYEPSPGVRAAVVRRVAPPPEPYVPPPVDTVGVRRSVGTTLRLAVEVLDGRRPPDQLATRLDPGTLGRWRAARACRRTSAVSRLLRLRLCLPHAEAAEGAAGCRLDGGGRAPPPPFRRHGPARARPP